tara:strand:+ start:8773 stop:10596 length:1824 start_codon:yes stop_codon:yes gene_type:complete
MATTIKSTNLDFTSIKNNLKTFLAQQNEFADYNFEASGLSNILDVLAYNTHYNGLIANFSLNESYLGTAQLRSSLVSLAEGIGYVPKSMTASRAVVSFSIDLSGLAERPTTVSLAPGIMFESSIDDITYAFQTRETVSATDDGSGIYQFKTTGGSSNITIYEGTQKTKTFIADAVSQDALYIVPDKNLDIDTAIVRVYESVASSSFRTYQNIKAATLINAQTALYILKESPNEYFELSFGDGVTFGISPQAGYKIELDFLSVSGAVANEGAVFTPVSQIEVSGSNYTISAATVTNSLGGDAKETNQSIRTNAPFQYATQNRMVTSDDYSSLVLRNFSTLIKDIKSFGGEDALKPEFGAVYMSIVYEDDVPASTKTTTQSSIQELVDQLSVVSFRLRFVDPVETFIETNTFFQFNSKLTTLSLNSITDSVNTAVRNYFSANTGKFGQAFRRSNVLTLIDEVSPAVLSSRMEVKMQQRIIPRLDAQNDFEQRFPTAIAAPDDVNYIVNSSSFVVAGKNCKIRNKLNSNKLQVVTLDGVTVVVDNVGSYEAANGTLSLVGFKPNSIVGGVNYIKISVLPANQSAIAPVRQDILEFDEDPSFASAVIVTSV